MLRSTGSSLLLLAVVACGSDPSTNAQVRAELMRLPGSAGASAETSPSTGDATAAVPYIWTTAGVSLSSVRAPIRSIGLLGSGVDIQVYACPGTTASACMVELNSPALQNLISTEPVPVRVGSYDRIMIHYCLSEGSYTAELTGTVALGGATWFTNTANNLSATGPAQPVSVSHTGCTNEYPIAPPLVISDTLDAVVTLRLYFDIRDLAFAALSDATVNSVRGVGCTEARTTGFVCAAYLGVTAVDGGTPPVVERYRVNSGATLGLLFHPTTGLFVGGYFRRYVVEGSANQPGFTPDGYVAEFTPNGGGTFSLRQYDDYVSFPAFRRETHSGTGTGEHGAIAYTAVRLP